MAVKPIPDGYHTVTPSLTIRGAARAIDFYKRAFGAEELMRMPSPDGRVIGNSVVMLADEFPEMGTHKEDLSPGEIGRRRDAAMRGA